jgi:type III secretory pathway component EscR
MKTITLILALSAFLSFPVLADNQNTENQNKIEKTEQSNQQKSNKTENKYRFKKSEHKVWD